MPALPNLRLISHKSSICFFERFAWQAVFSRPFFQKNYPHSLAKCLSCRCRQQREKYAVLRQEQSVSCQSKILPRCHNSLSAHSVPSDSCWGVPSPNPAVTAYAAVVPLAAAAKIYFSRWLRFLKKCPLKGERTTLLPCRPSAFRSKNIFGAIPDNGRKNVH